MKNIMRLFALLLLAAVPASLRAQSITQQPQNQSVVAGQTATFTVTVGGGPCRSAWYVNGVLHYGAVASSFSYSIANVTAAQNGTTVQVELYGCTGGSAKLFSNKAVLTVTPPPPPLPTITTTIAVSYTDGTIPPAQLVISKVVVNPDGTTITTAILQLVPDAAGNASGSFAFDPTLWYRADFTLPPCATSCAIQSYYFLEGPLIHLLYPGLTQVKASAILIKVAGVPTGIQSSSIVFE